MRESSWNYLNYRCDFITIKLPSNIPWNFIIKNNLGYSEG